MKIMKNNIKILLVEDDENLGTLLKDYLIAKGYYTELATDGDKGFTLFAKGNFDLCLLDVMMPKKDGFSLAAEIRKVNEKIPIIFLTAKSMKEDTLKGFSVGGDDYITKPFSMEELLARIQAVLKRTMPAENEKKEKEVYKIKDFRFYLIKRMLQYKDEEPIKLTSKESELLKLLCENKNKVLERTYALKAVWEDDNYFNARSMDVYIAKLRKYFKKDPDIEIINVHGKGFRFYVNEN
jgi:DNA-binding response OmpR family regulator